MKIIISLAITVLLFHIVLHGQQNKESWQLPLENGLVYYKQATYIPVNKNELCEYFLTQKYFNDFFDKLNDAAFKTTKNKFWKGTDSYSYSLQLNTGNEEGITQISNCNPSENDTIYGKVEYDLDWTSWGVTNGKNGTKNTKVSFFIIIIFMRNEDIFVSLKGLSIKHDEYHPGTGRSIHRDEYLADAYQKFISSKNKSKDDKKLFSKISELSDIFYSTLFSSLQMQVNLFEN